MDHRLLALACTLLSALGAAAQCDATYPAEPVHVTPGPIPHVDRGGTPVYLIPTLVHIHYGGFIQPLGVLHVQPILDLCNADLRALNDDIGEVVPAFADLVGDLGVELRLATRDEQGNCISGILYHEFDPVDGIPNTGPTTIDTRHYLNIHIIPSTNSFASYPSLITDPYNPGDAILLSSWDAINFPRALAHEVGHWLGLYHVWGPENTSAVSCGDDGIADTPITAGSVVGTCDTGLDHCTPGVVENVQNHMDYSTCGIMFTQGQADHALAVLGDPALVRSLAVDPANLLATGVVDPASCPITAAIYQRTLIQCSGNEVQFRAMAEHALPDSVHWTFTGGSPASSTADDPIVQYTNSGNYAVQLTVYGGGGSATASTTLTLEVPDPEANGFTVVGTYPFSEGFENGFSLPAPHLRAAPSSSPTWEPFAQAGHASANCLYVPAEPPAVADTNDLVLGNFDMSGLEQATVQFKVASTNYPASTWTKLELRFRDLCSNSFSGDIWAVWQLDVMATDNGMNYVPSDDGQWVTLTATQPAWNLAASAELTLRLIRPALPATFTPEAFYLDDLYIGEEPGATGLAEWRSMTHLRVAPNPTRDAITVELPGPLLPGATLRVLDAQGRVVAHAPARTGTHRLAEGLAPGLYFVQYGAEVVRVVVE